LEYSTGFYYIFTYSNFVVTHPMFLYYLWVGWNCRSCLSIRNGVSLSKRARRLHPTQKSNPTPIRQMTILTAIHSTLKKYIPYLSNTRQSKQRTWRTFQKRFISLFFIFIRLFYIRLCTSCQRRNSGQSFSNPNRSIVHVPLIKPSWK
jgi:hypothetical protein